MKMRNPEYYTKLNKFNTQTASQYRNRPKTEKINKSAGDGNWI